MGIKIIVSLTKPTAIYSIIIKINLQSQCSHVLFSGLASHLNGYNSNFFNNCLYTVFITGQYFCHIQASCYLCVCTRNGVCFFIFYLNSSSTCLQPNNVIKAVFLINQLTFLFYDNFRPN